MLNQPEHSRDVLAISAAQEDEYRFPYHYVTRFGPDAFRQHFVDSWGINYASAIDFVVERINNESPASLLDIGCGDGRLTREIFTRTGVPKVLGIDTSLRAISLAKAMNHDLPAINFDQTDISSLSIGEFNAAVLMEVIEHIPPDDLPNFIRNTRAHLKCGARLHITVPHTNKPVEYKHFQHFTCDSIATCLSMHFDIINIIPFERRGLRRLLLNALLCNRFFILNNQRLLDMLYRWYKQHLFLCPSEGECQRIYIEAVAR